MSQRHTPYASSKEPLDNRSSIGNQVYDTELVQRVVYHPIQDRVVEHLRRAGRRRVLDVGCGAGILATRIRDELEPDVVYGCDFSAGMLAQAEARSSGVHWLNSRAECLPLRAGAVDAVVSSAAFHFFDQRAALPSSIVCCRLAGSSSSPYPARSHQPAARSSPAGCGRSARLGSRRRGRCAGRSRRPGSRS